MSILLNIDLLINNELCLNKDIIEYGDFKPNLIIFNNDEKSFTIINSWNENQDAYKNLRGVCGIKNFFINLN